MALDMSIIRGPRNIDFSQLYAIRNSIVDGMDWYLGDDKGKRHERYLALKEKALLLTREKVLSDVEVSEDMRKCLSEINPTQFAIYLSWTVGSIADYVDENNTHLEFDWDLLPGITVLDTCSWNLKDIFEQCSIQRDYPDRGFVVEIDLNKVAEANSKWHKKSFKMNMAKWIGWFFPNVGYRIVKDCMRELGLNDYWVDVDDLIYYKNEIEKVAKFMNPDTDRLWLVSSY